MTLIEGIDDVSKMQDQIERLIEVNKAQAEALLEAEKILYIVAGEIVPKNKARDWLDKYGGKDEL